MGYQCTFDIKFFDDNYAKFQHKIWRNPKWRLRWYQYSFSHKFFDDNFVSNVTPFFNARVTYVFTYTVIWPEKFSLSALFPGNETLNNCLGAIDLNIDRIWLNWGIYRMDFFKAYRINMPIYKSESMMIIIYKKWVLSIALRASP